MHPRCMFPPTRDLDNAGIAHTSERVNFDVLLVGVLPVTHRHISENVTTPEQPALQLRIPWYSYCSDAIPAEATLQGTLGVGTTDERNINGRALFELLIFSNCA